SLRQVVWLVTGFTLGHSITLSLAVLGWISPQTTIVEALIGFTIALVAAENIGAKTGANRPIAYGAAAVLGLMLLLSLTGLMVSSLPLISLVGLILFTLSYLPTNGEFSAVKMRPALSLAFGLIHGFGFAAILQEIGLPQEQLWPALLGFNIGVELGQLLIVAVLWIIYLRLKKTKELTSAAADLGSAVLCGLGLFWFVARSYGPTIS
ncbi:MAG: HupE/UreJ family protein, partial [Porticoccaceae bacterium]